MIFKPHTYQQRATDHILANPSSGLLMEMGLGKTVATLNAIDILMFQEFSVKKVLIIAPKMVAKQTWGAEIAKWAHLRHLRLSVMVGSESDRIKALRAKSELYTINRENVQWLVAFLGGAWPFDMVVIDELSSFKSPKSVRFKALRTVLPRINRIVGLTGTPIPNGLLDLWSQMYLLDRGERLGKTITDYRSRFFKKDPHLPFAKYEVLRGPDEIVGEGYYERKIYDKISDICISMRAKDYLDLPERIDITREVILPRKIMQKYFDFEKKLVLSLDDSDDISAVNAAGLTNKLLQFANGAVYDEDGNWHAVHDEKLEALGEDIEAANGHPMLIFYQFRHDLERILARFKEYKPVVIKGVNDIEKWNKKEIPLMLAHAASAGHGLNLQEGGNLVEWFGCPWGSELYRQAVARLDRQGQLKAVVNKRLACADTMDMEVLLSLDLKYDREDALMRAVKAVIKKYKK